jgi:HAD superfamily hydrolase (TIGR01509 family)
MIRNIIWDLDGTLFDTYPAIARAFKKAVEHLGADVSAERTEELAKISLSHCVATLSTQYQLKKEDIEREFKRYYADISAEESPPFNGVVEIIDYICLIGGKNVIVTHRDRESTMELLSTHDLIDKFAEIIVGDDGYPKKPDPTTFNTVIEEHNLDKKETISVGDRQLDIGAGQAAGIFSCLFGDTIDGNEPDLVVEDFDDLYQFILAKNLLASK